MKTTFATFDDLKEHIGNTLRSSTGAIPIRPLCGAYEFDDGSVACVIPTNTVGAATPNGTTTSLQIETDEDDNVVCMALVDRAWVVAGVIIGGEYTPLGIPLTVPRELSRDAVSVCLLANQIMEEITANA